MQAHTLIRKSSETWYYEWIKLMNINFESHPAEQQANVGLWVGLGKLFPKIHLLFYSFIPRFSAYYSLKPAHYSVKPAYYSYIILKLILKTS